MAEAEGVEQTVRVSRQVPVPPARAFRAWTTPAEVERWWLPESFTDAEVEIDLREGGAFRLAMRNPAGDPVVAVGTYREVVEGERIVCSWRWEPDFGGETRLTVEFRPREGGTEIVLVHEGFPDADVAAQHEGGWVGCLDRLEPMLR